MESLERTVRNAVYAGFGEAKTADFERLIEDVQRERHTAKRLRIIESHIDGAASTDHLDVLRAMSEWVAKDYTERGGMLPGYVERRTKRTTDAIQEQWEALVIQPPPASQESPKVVARTGRLRRWAAAALIGLAGVLGSASPAEAPRDDTPTVATQYAAAPSDAELREYAQRKGVFTTFPLAIEDKAISGPQGKRWLDYDGKRGWDTTIGTDFHAPKGTAVLAMGDGTVGKTIHTKDGRFLPVRFDNGWECQYWHVDAESSEGTQVKEGERIATVIADQFRTDKGVRTYAAHLDVRCSTADSLTNQRLAKAGAPGRDGRYIPPTEALLDVSSREAVFTGSQRYDYTGWEGDEVGQLRERADRYALALHHAE